MQVTTIGLDLAKNVFQVHGITEDEEVAKHGTVAIAERAETTTIAAATH